jgi:putative DNA primase/helicase
MLNDALRRRIDEAKRRASGRWPGILEQLGVEPTVLGKRNQPCPACGGKDRFQFTDKYGDGNYICRGCGAGDGFALLERCLGWTFVEALKAVEGIVGATNETARGSSLAASPSPMQRLAERIWQEAKPVAAADAVATYLLGRGLSLVRFPAVLRTHPALGFYVRQAGESRATRLRTYPAMLALVQDPAGHAVTLHRTYLEHGAKAPVAECRKLLSAGVNGAAVRLFEPGDELAIAEGIETALAVHLSSGKPTWAALSAGGMQKLRIPAGVTRVAIYADHDASYVGQAAAYALAKRLKCEPSARGAREVTVHVPSDVDSDWADVLREGRARAA